MAIHPLSDGPQPGALVLARTQVRAEIRRRLEGVSEVTLPGLTRDMVAWVQASPALADAFLQEMLRPLVYDTVQQEVARTRGTAYELLPQGDRVQRRADAEAQGHLSRRFVHWMEHVGGSSKRLLDLTRDELRLAAGERRQRADAELLLAQLWESLARDVPAGRTVGDVFTPDAIAVRYEQVKARRDAGPQTQRRK